MSEANKRTVKETEHAENGHNAVKTPDHKKQKITEKPDVVLEEGKIFFLYRPRVGHKTVNSLSEVQRFYFLLEPEGSTKKRLVVVGKKKLPAKQERFFGFVEAVAEKMEDLTGGLGPEQHETATQGTRRTEASRIVGDGVYSIAEKEGSSTYLVWRLEVPAEPGQVQDDLCIGKEGSLAISIKNPKKPNPSGRNVGLDTKADFGDKQKLFEGTPGGYAWISVKDPSLLDHKNAELLLIGTGKDIAEELGQEVKEYTTEKVKEDVKEVTGGEDEDEEEKLIDEMRKELKAPEVKLDEAPASDKEWK